MRIRWGKKGKGITDMNSDDITIVMSLADFEMLRKFVREGEKHVLKDVKNWAGGKVNEWFMNEIDAAWEEIHTPRKVK